jgi:valyl-tRNA synthetase
LDSAGLLTRVEDKIIPTPYSERGKCVIEYMVREEWFVDAKRMAARAISAAEKGSVQFLPEHRYNLYMAWMKDIREWSISRQLWWGHQIPAWYGEDGDVYVAETEEDAYEQLERSGKGGKLTREKAVLDTWFSSALWPFSTLGWPDKTAELARYYPTDLLITAADIIFFWVARMMMMGLYVMDDVPFRCVYFNGLVRDKNGQKFSKTKGNGVDPLEAVDKFGADALRYWVSCVPIGTDLRYSEEDVKRGGKLLTKLWNAAKYVLGNLADFDPSRQSRPAAAARFLEDRWVLSELNKTIREVRRHMDKYDSFNAREAVDSFFWGVFCDQYLEFIKDRFWSPQRYSPESRACAQWTLWEVLRAVIGLYAPFVPFLTEELWQKIYKDWESADGNPKTLHLTEYPRERAEWDTDVARMQMALDILKAVRKLRTERKIGNGAKLSALAVDADIPAELHGLLLSGARADKIISAPGAEQVENQNIKIDITAAEGTGQ